MRGNKEVKEGLEINKLEMQSVGATKMKKCKKRDEGMGGMS